MVKMCDGMCRACGDDVSMAVYRRAAGNARSAKGA